MIREVLMNKALLPTINILCDPENINIKLISLLNSKSSRKSKNHIYSHAANYEEFIKLIKTSKSLDELKELNYRIMVEIMHSTIISNLKKTSNIRSNTNIPIINNNQINTTNSNQNSSKGELLMSRDLQKYKNQLKYAKILCERRIKGFNEVVSDCGIQIENEKKHLIEQEVVEFDKIMKSDEHRNSFMKFLEIDGSDALLRFWSDINKLKRIDKIIQQYEFANKIYENYISKYDSPVKDEIGRELCKEMQLFLIGNNSLNVFLVAQEKIYKILTNDHYPSFLVSDLYQNVLRNLTRVTDNSQNYDLDLNEQSFENTNETTLTTTNYLKKRIEILKNKLNIKFSALNAIKSNESVIEENKVIEILENDIVELQQQIGIAEYHLEKTEIWCEYMGRWKTNIISVDISISDSADSAPTPHFVIQVNLFDKLHSDIIENKGTHEGWIIIRTLKQFQNLHQRLIDINKTICSKYKKLPTITRTFMSKTFDENKINQIKTILNEYLQFITNDDIICNSQDLYSFLCPNPDYVIETTKKFDNINQINNSVDKLKYTPSSSLNTQINEKFSMSSIFDGHRSKDKIENNLDDFFNDPIDNKSVDNKDSIAEPIYNLVEEIFELKDARWFRKTILAFVQFTYGATINRTIRQSIYSTLNEDMVAYYLQIIRNLFWEFNAQTGTYTLIRKNGDNSIKLDSAFENRNEAKIKLLQNIPEILNKLIGERNSSIGIIKIFENVQENKLNKHLFYSYLELLISELCSKALE